MAKPVQLFTPHHPRLFHASFVPLMRDAVDPTGAGKEGH
jgi:hypothetical protein